MNVFKKYKKNLIVLGIILIYALITLGIFLRPHFVHDTYRIYGDGLGGTEFFLYQGRLITHWFFSFFNLITILSIENVQLISVVLSIIFLSLSSLIVYILVSKRINTGDSIIKKVIVLLIVVGIFFNMYIIEWLVFMESAVMAFGVLTSILAAYCLLQLNKNTKNIYATILFIISVFCYQASVSIGGSILILFIIYDNKDEKILTIIKKLFFSMLTYGIALLCNLIFVKVVNNGMNDTRASGDVDILYNIMYSIKCIKSYFIETYSYLPKWYVFTITIAILLITLYHIIKSKNYRYILYVIFTIFCFWLLSILPMFAMSSKLIYFMPRSIPFIGGIFSFVCLISLLFIKDKLLNNKYVNIGIATNFIIITMLIINILCQNMQNSTQDTLIGKIVLQNILEYEEKTGIDIETIVIVPDSEISFNSPNIHPYSDITAKAFTSDWSSRAIMKYITDRRFTFKTGTREDKEEFFKDIEADDFNINQIVFKDNTLYLLQY